MPWVWKIRFSVTTIQLLRRSSSDQPTQSHRPTTARLVRSSRRPGVGTANAIHSQTTLAARARATGRMRTIGCWCSCTWTISPAASCLRTCGATSITPAVGTGSPSALEQRVEELEDVLDAVADDVPDAADDVGGLGGVGEDRVDQEDDQQPPDDLLDGWHRHVTSPDLLCARGRRTTHAPVCRE